MKKWMVALVGAMVAGQAGAGCFDGCFEVGGEALYWKATGADFQYAESVIGGGGGHEHVSTVVSDYDWGFRVFGTYFSDDCCSFATLDWTYLRTKDGDILEGNASRLWRAGFGGGGDFFAPTHADLRLEYDKVNLRLGRNLCTCCKGQLYAYGGGRYIHIEERRGYQSIGEPILFPIAIFDESTSFEGGGVEGGFGGTYDLWCGLELNVNIGLTAEVGQLKNEASTFSLDLPFVNAIQSFKIPSRTICVPGTELRLGLSYTYKCDCWWITGDIGYQMDYRWNALALQQGSRVFGQAVPSQRVNVGFAGLYFGLRARF